MEAEFRRAREMFAAAVALLGAYELSPENRYWLQSNNQSDSPDVMAVKQTEQDDAPILLEETQIEIVDFEEHFPSDSIVDFLLATKLSPKSGYSEHMMIVVMVNRQLKFNTKEIHVRLSELKPKPTIYIIGRASETESGNFHFFQANPQSLKKTLSYGVIATAAKYDIPARVNFGKGTARKISYEKSRLSPITIYETLGLNRDKIYKKFGKPE